MLIDQIKERMFQAMKTGATVEKEVLRTVIGEVTRTGDAASDERVLNVLRKLVKSNQETLRAATDPAQRATLEREITILEDFLPRSLTSAEVRELLGPVAAEKRQNDEEVAHLCPQRSPPHDYASSCLGCRPSRSARASFAG